jgi:choline dehydrogenase
VRRAPTEAGCALYDYVIVGGGSAGCVLAARLSEQPDLRVLLLEAGPSDRNPLIHIPAGYFRLSTGPVSWGYHTAPQQHAAGREMEFTQARVIGGGGSINAQVFTRGTPDDYDGWAFEQGCDGWSFAEVQKYFVRSEDNDSLSGPYHGVGGPLGVSSQAPQPLTLAFVQACEQAGMPQTDDFNGARQAGAGVYQTTTRRARRCSAAVGYLAPARGRPNLEVRAGCSARRVLIERGRAVGVEYEQDGRLHVALAEREVILAGGGIGSPRLLLLSGIGPADHLAQVGVTPVHDLPGVGQNFHDHYAIDAIYELSGPWSLDRYQRRPWMALAGLRYLLFRDGPAASTVVEGGAFWQADPASSTPDTQLHFVVGAGVPPGVPAVPSGNGCMLNSYLLRPRSRGTVTLRSDDPRQPPAIDPNYLADPYDLQMTVAGVRLMRDVMRQPAFARYVRGEHLPGVDLASDTELAEFVRRFGRSGYHPTGACKMGTDPLAVVAPDLRVHGLAGLRVCDSSVMPSVVSSNTNAPTIMIAERASDLIRGHAPATSAAADLRDAEPMRVPA